MLFCNQFVSCYFYLILIFSSFSMFTKSHSLANNVYASRQIRILFKFNERGNLLFEKHPCLRETGVFWFWNSPGFSCFFTSIFFATLIWWQTVNMHAYTQTEQTRPDQTRPVLEFQIEPVGQNTIELCKEVKFLTIREISGKII